MLCPDGGINTENSAIRGSNLKGYKPPFSFSEPQWHLQGLDEAGQVIILCDYLQERKRWGPTNHFLYNVFHQGWYEFKLKYWRFCFGFCKTEVPDSVSRDLWCYQNWHGAIENSESKKFLNLASHFFLWWRLGGLLKWLKETSFCERKEEVITKTSTLLGRKISYYEFFG